MRRKILILLCGILLLSFVYGEEEKKEGKVYFKATNKRLFDSDFGEETIQEKQKKEAERIAAENRAKELEKEKAEREKLKIPDKAPIEEKKIEVEPQKTPLEIIPGNEKLQSKIPIPETSKSEVFNKTIAPTKTSPKKLINEGVIIKTNPLTQKIDKILADIPMYRSENKNYTIFYSNVMFKDYLDAIYGIDGATYFTTSKKNRTKINSIENYSIESTNGITKLRHIESNRNAIITSGFKLPLFMKSFNFKEF